MKEFPICDVLSLATTLLCSESLQGFVALLEYMTGKNVWSNQVCRIMFECQPSLFEQYPQLNSLEFKTDFEEMYAHLTPDQSRAERMAIVNEWVAKQAIDLGAMMPIAPLAPGEHLHIDVRDEGEAQFGKKRVIVHESH